MARGLTPLLFGIMPFVATALCMVFFNTTFVDIGHETLRSSAATRQAGGVFEIFLTAFNVGLRQDAPNYVDMGDTTTWPARPASVPSAVAVAGWRARTPPGALPVPSAVA
eukprot:5060077-Heterocapsa_arctica.AAC.1